MDEILDAAEDWMQPGLGLEEIQPEVEQPTTEQPVDSAEPAKDSSVEEPSTEGNVDKFPDIAPGEYIPGHWGLRKPRPGIGGFFQDTAQGMWEGAAPIVGVSDTIIDFVNWASAGDKYNIPKLPEYEDKVSQSIRNISGLVIPSLGLRGMILRTGASAHASKQAAPWLQKLGNRKSFQYIARFGADIFSGGLVDYVAEQNQKDDNLGGVLKKYWPETFQWIPDRYATTDADSPDLKRQKNVNEGAIFGMLSSIVEGVAYLTRAGRSLKRTSQIVGQSEAHTKRLNEMVKDEFTDVKFSDNPIEDSILRNYARKEKALNELGGYYIDTQGEDFTEPIVGVHDVFDEGETLVRTQDADGIIGAAADQAQIANNIESAYGRLGAIISEASRKRGIELNNLSTRTLVQELADNLEKAGKFSKRLNSGKNVTEAMINDAGRVLSATLLNPRVDSDDIIGLLSEFKKSIDGSAMRIVGKKGINRAVKELRKQMVDMDVQKARAYLVTSEAGQISDMAEGMRLMEGGVSYQRTIDLMADRLEVLMVEKGLANFEGNSLFANMRVWNQAIETGDKEIINGAADAITNNSNSRLLEIIPEAKRWTQTLKQVADENPEFIKPLILASELADGDVDSLFKLHRWAANKLGTFNKAIYDHNPKVPSIINKAIWSNLFNSALSAFATPIKAGVGNLTGLLGKSSATIIGAVRSGDLPAARRAITAFYSIDDTLTQANGYMQKVFKKASLNPKEVSMMTRGDIAITEDPGLLALKEYALAAAENGEYGPGVLVRIFSDLEDISMDPVLRFGGNSMTALDGFSKSIYANAEAKFEVLNKLAQSGEVLSKADFQKAANEVYSKWFDTNGLIKNDAVDVGMREIALNADSPTVDAINTLIGRFPAARAFIWFPRTTANVIDVMGKWSPAGVFAREHQQLWGGSGWFGNKTLADFSTEEIADVLRRRGFEMDEFALENFERIRHEVKGKAAIGGYMTTMAVFAAMNGRCTGTGHYDRARQRARVKNGWKPKSCKVPGSNKYVSYEWMGPIGDWLAIVTDIVDNFDGISTAVQEDLLNKALWVFSSALVNRSSLAQLEPLNDIFQGNGAQANRFASNFTNVLLPLGSFRNELGKLMYPGLRQIRQEYDDQVRNRNAWLDMVDPEGKIPFMVDPIDGKKIGYQENFFIRAWNNYSPIKIHDAPSPERQFLIDIEFNSSPMMNMSNGGVELENNEIAAINSKMGEQGNYKLEVSRIMKRASKITYKTTDGKTITGFTEILKHIRRGGISSEVLDTALFQDIYADLKFAYTKSKMVAEESIDSDMLNAIREREYEKNVNKYNQRAGDLDRMGIDLSHY